MVTGYVRGRGFPLTVPPTSTPASMGGLCLLGNRESSNKMIVSTAIDALVCSQATKTFFGSESGPTHLHGLGGISSRRSVRHGRSRGKRGDG